jgi:glycosyltransferase involved in cell wall biosynthesis
MYQTPIFKVLEKYTQQDNTNLSITILFGDDLSLRHSLNTEFNTSFSYGNDLLEGYKYKFLKNYSRDSRQGVMSRINPGIFFELYKEKYDVILIHGYESLTAWFALIAAKLTNTKIIWRGESTLRKSSKKDFFRNQVKRNVLKFFFDRCDAIMYSCSGNKDYLKFHGVEEYKLFFIPCAVNNKFFQTERKKYINHAKDIKKSNGINDKDMVVLFSARITSRKRPFDLLNALSKIDHSNITVLFVGDGIERKDVENLAKDMGVKAVFTGFKSQLEIPRYYSIADVCVVISDYDPSPKVINEAMNFELPVIVTDVVGTASDLVTNNVNGFIVEVGNIDEIANRLNFINTNRIKLERMGKASLKQVENWNYDKDVKNLLKATKYTLKSK